MMAKELITEYISKPIEFEEELKAFYKTFIKVPEEDFVILDIGASDGLDSLRYSKLFPSATIHSFEPEPMSYGLLSEYIKTYGGNKIHSYNYALGDIDDNSTDFYISDGYPDALKKEENRGFRSSSMLAPQVHLLQWPWIKFEKKTTKMCRYDSLNIPVAHYIHMDVQGSELKVLSGFGDKLKDILGIRLEVSKVPMYKDQPLCHDIFNFMIQHGFTLFNKYEGIDIPGFTGDKFYVKA